jgi:hypothetical protein
MNSRRKFLVGCSAFTVATVLAPAGVIADSVTLPGKSISVDELDYAAFSRHLNTRFQIHTTLGDGIDVSLAAVKTRPETNRRAGRRPLPDAEFEKFSLVFSGTRVEMLAQNIYTVEHAVLGRFELFLVPILTRNPARIDYEAIFNRPRVGSAAAVPIASRTTPLN